jgi:hypothetical protein
LELEKRYQALRIIATIYNIVAVLSLVIAVLIFFVTIVIAIGFSEKLGNASWYSVPFALVNLFFGVIGAVTAKSLSELIGVFLSLEENTRSAKQQLETIAENTRATAVILHHMNKNK